MVVCHSISTSFHLENFHDFIPQVVDDFDCNATAFGFLEGAGEVAVECFPCLCVDLGFKGSLQRLVGIVGTKEIGLAYEG